ncbi:hypothetical protein GCM10009677_37940 [Sphaerisporangium rubeum]
MSFCWAVERERSSSPRRKAVEMPKPSISWYRTPSDTVMTGAAAAEAGAAATSDVPRSAVAKAIRITGPPDVSVVGRSQGKCQPPIRRSV